MFRFTKSFTSSRSQTVAMALVLYQFIFLNFFLPGHTRGSITLDGKHIADPAPCCCCCGDRADLSKSDSHGTPSKHDKEECAICHFAARVLPTPVFKFVLPELGLLETRPLARPAIPVPADVVRTYQPRGPPAYL